MAGGVDDEVAVAEAYANARSLRADDATAAELARQCYRDLFPGVPEDRVDRKSTRLNSSHCL